MKIGLKHFRVVGFVALLAASALSFVDCGKKSDPNHAPTCQPGQFLVYSVYQGGYSCQMAQVSNNGYAGNGYSGGYTQPYGQQPYGQTPYAGQTPYGQAPYGANQYGQQGGFSNLIAPVQYCGAANQILVNWNNTGWYCLFSDVIYGSGDSPQGYVPPQQRGGEYCITSYMATQQYPATAYPGVGNTNPQGLNCTAPLTCHPQGQAAVGSTNNCVQPNGQPIPNCTPATTQPVSNSYGAGLPGLCSA